MCGMWSQQADSKVGFEDAILVFLCPVANLLELDFPKAGRGPV